MANENKIKIVEAAEKRFKDSPGIYFTKYTGMNVDQATKLRKQFREKNVTFNVTKNTLNKIAARNAGIEGLDEILLGQIAIAFSDDDPTSPAKVIKDFKKENEDCLDVVGVYFDGQLFDPDKYKELADLPSKDELLGKFASGLNYPMSTLASTLNSLMPKFLTALNEINKQKQ